MSAERLSRRLDALERRAAIANAETDIVVRHIAADDSKSGTHKAGDLLKETHVHIDRHGKVTRTEVFPAAHTLPDGN